MGTTSDELKYSDPPQRICGQDEQYAADVVQTQDSLNRLCVETAERGVGPSEYKVYWTRTETIYTGGSYQSVFSVTGKSGVFYGFHIDSDTDKLQIKLTIDGSIVVQDIAVKQLKDFDLEGAQNAQFVQNKGGLFTLSGSDIDFSPHRYIAYSNSIDVSVKRNDDNDVKIKGVIVYYTEV